MKPPLPKLWKLKSSRAGFCPATSEETQAEPATRSGHSESGWAQRSEHRVKFSAEGRKLSDPSFEVRKRSSAPLCVLGKKKCSDGDGKPMLSARVRKTMETA